MNTMEKGSSSGRDNTLNVAIVGGGPGCKAIMDMILAEKLKELRMKLIGVACTNAEAVGYRYAQEQGIYITDDYRDLYNLKDLNMIIELTGREDVANEISLTKPDHVHVMDHVAARLFWDVFQIEEERIAERKQAEGALRESEEKSRTISLELAVGLSEVFEALKEISSGDPSVRIPETSGIELIAKLKHIVNLTAQPKSAA